MTRQDNVELLKNIALGVVLIGGGCLLIVGGVKLIPQQ